MIDEEKSSFGDYIQELMQQTCIASGREKIQNEGLAWRACTTLFTITPQRLPPPLKYAG
jgi:hypothetical protein